MKLTDITAEPKLVSVLIDDADIVEQYGEPLEFWTWDRQPMDKFVRLANLAQDDFATVINIMRDLILDESGEPVMQGNRVLPSRVLMRAVSRITDLLGK